MSIYQDHAYKHGVGWSTWHFQWVTKYRYKVFSNYALQKLCEIFLMEAARRYQFEIDELEVAPDHVHVIARLRPSMSPAKAIMLMKGYSSRMLFIAGNKNLSSFYWKNAQKRSLWGDGKFMGSVGHITLETAKEYVKNHETYGAEKLLIRESPPFRVGEEVNFCLIL
jgi:putative transposase